MQEYKSPNKIRQTVAVGILSAILLAGQLALAPLPNIELVSTLLIIYTQVFKKQVFFIIYVFVLLEGLVFGFGIWWMSYLYIWSMLALIVLALQKLDNAVLWAVVSGAFGLLFGALCAIPYLISGGIGAAFAYWSAGIPYDILHCGGNFALTLILYKPLTRLIRKLHQNMQNGQPL